MITTHLHLLPHYSLPQPQPQPQVLPRAPAAQVLSITLSRRSFWHSQTYFAGAREKGRNALDRTGNTHLQFGVEVEDTMGDFTIVSSPQIGSCGECTVCT